MSSNLLLCLIASAVAVAAAAFTTAPSRRISIQTLPPLCAEMDRRAALGLACGIAFSPKIALAGLLEDYEVGSAPKEAKLQSKQAAVTTKKAISNIEPNLRSNYYYPTNKKRYLPRIKKCNDAIPEAAERIGEEDWVEVAKFAGMVADDTILPMKLYTSSLLGGGTNVKTSFTGEMKTASLKFEKGQKALVKAVGKKDQTASSRALEDMASAMLAYRTSGRLLGPDGGGDIPSVDEIRRSACRVQGRTFEKKLKDRDARLNVNSNQVSTTDVSKRK